MKVSHYEELRNRVKEIEVLACKHDGIDDPNREDYFLSKDNPWLDLLMRARRNLTEAIVADEKHGTLNIHKA